MEVKLKDIVILVAVVLGLVGIIVGAVGLNTSNQASNHNAAISLYLSDPDNLQFILDQIGFLQDEDAIEWLNDNFVSEGEFAHHNGLLNKTLDAVVADLEAAGVAVTTLQNKFIIIEHTNQVPATTPDSTARCAGDFDLEMLQVDGNVRKNKEFKTTESIFVKGTYPKDGVQYDYQVLKTGQSSPVKTSFGNVKPDLIVLGAFNEFKDQEDGSYTAEFEINGVTDCISFKIVK